jgi:hypothetical protein
LLLALLAYQLLGTPHEKKDARKAGQPLPGPTATGVAATIMQVEKSGALQAEIVKAADWGADYVSATTIWDSPESEITGTRVAASLDSVVVTNHDNLQTELLGMWVTAMDSAQNELRPVRIDKNNLSGEKVIGPHRKESYELEFEAVFKERIRPHDLVIRISAAGHAILTVPPPKDLLIPKASGPAHPTDIAQTTVAQEERARRERKRVRAVLNNLPDSDLQMLNAIAKQGPQSVLIPELALANLLNANLIMSLGASHRLGESFVDLHPDARHAVIEYVGAYWPRPRGQEGG